MITPTPVQTTTQIKADVKAADLATLLGSVGASGVLPADLGGGKTLADVVSLNVTLLPTPLPDGTVARINATIKL
jgi:hypothetical protein